MFAFNSNTLWFSPQEKLFRDAVRGVMDIVIAMTDTEPFSKDAAPSAGAGKAVAIVMPAAVGGIKKHAKGSGTAPAAPAEAPLGLPGDCTAKYCLMTSPVVCNALVGCMIRALEWNDGSCFRRLIATWLRLFQHLSPMPEFTMTFAKDLFQTAFEALLAMKPWTIVSVQLKRPFDGNLTAVICFMFGSNCRNHIRSF